MGEEWVGVCTRKRVCVKGARLSVTFLPFILLLAFCVHRWIKRTHALLISLFIYPMRSPQKPKSLSLSRTHTLPPKMSSHKSASALIIQNNKCQSLFLLTNSLRWHVSINKNMRMHSQTLLRGLVRCVISPRGDDTCAACLSGSPVGNWEPAQCHGSVGINEAYWAKDTEA